MALWAMRSICWYARMEAVEVIRRSLFIENETVMRRNLDVSFRPEAPITHQQAVLILQRLRAHKRQWKDCSKKNSIWRKKAMRGHKPRMAFCFCGKVGE